MGWKAAVAVVFVAILGFAAWQMLGGSSPESSSETAGDGSPALTIGDLDRSTATDAEGGESENDVVAALEARRSAIERPVEETRLAHPTDSEESPETAHSPILRVSGRVTDEDGAPVADAVLTIVDPSGGEENVRTLGQADHMGRYAMTLPDWNWEGPRATTLLVNAEASGLARVRKTASVSRDNPEATLDFTLVRGEAIAGEVVWQDGGPVPNASLLIFGGSQATGQTDRQGRFRVEGLAPGRVSIAVSPDGVMPYQSGSVHEVGNEDIVVTLLPRIGVITGTLRGSVDKELKPGVLLNLGDDVSGFASWSTVTDDEGAYRFEQIPIEFWYITVPGQPAPIGYFGLRIDDHEREMDLYLPQPVTLAGVVELAGSEEPVPDFALRVAGVSARTNQQFEPAGQGRTDAEGHFRFEEVSVGYRDDSDAWEPNREVGYHLGVESLEPPWILSSGRQTSNLPVRDLADLENLRISVSRGDVLHVETIDVSGAPVPGAPVQLHLPSGESRSIGRTDAQGRATVVRPQGISESQLTASTSDWPVMISPVLTSAESTVQVQAIPVAGLAIRVVEESGDPVPGAMISGYADIDLVGKGARQFPGRLYNLRGISGATDEEGRLEISRAPLCALELEVYRRVGTEYRDLPTNERIDLSGPTVSPEVTIVLRAPEETTIRGKVVNEEGAPVGGAVVREAFRPPTDEEAPTTTNMDGRFEIRVPMRNGEARIYAAAEGYLGGSWRGPPTEEEVSITLPRGIRLHGRIARSEADGAEQVWLYPFTPSQGWSEGWRRHYHEMSVNFPADATEVPFSWDLPKQGWGETTVSLFLMAVSSDKEVGTGVSELQVETQTDYDLGTLFLRPECTVSGIVEDSDGNPLGGATVMWEESNPQQYYSSNSAIRRWQDTTGSSGRFSLSALPPETSRLVVTREGYHGRSEPVLLPREEDVRIALHRPEGATITIEVIDRDGAPLAGIQSTLTLDDLNSVRATDHRGRAEHEEVPPGEYRLTLSLSQGEGSLNATAMVEMGDTDRTLTFDMRQWFHVAGFLMRGGEAQTQQYMNTHTSWAMGEHMDSINGWMRTNEVGAFDFTLPPGTVRLSTQSGASMELEVTADIEDLVWDLDASN